MCIFKKMASFSCFAVYRAPKRPKTKIPRDFYIDGTYFKPQKQAKSRTLKMAELALVKSPSRVSGLGDHTAPDRAPAPPPPAVAHSAPSACFLGPPTTSLFLGFPAGRPDVTLTPRDGWPLVQTWMTRTTPCEFVGIIMDRANSAIFKVRDFACFCGSKYVPSM